MTNQGTDTDDAMGTAEPPTREDQLGENTFGDQAADLSDEPKIVSSPANSANANDGSDTDDEYDEETEVDESDS